MPAPRTHSAGNRFKLITQCNNILLRRMEIAASFCRIKENYVATAQLIP
jgi:hypothetical protein